MRRRRRYFIIASFTAQKIEVEKMRN